MDHFVIDTTIYDTGMLIEHSKKLPNKIWAFNHYDWQRYARELELRCSELSQKLLPLLSQDDAIEAWRKALNAKEQQLAAMTKERDEMKEYAKLATEDCILATADRDRLAAEVAKLKTLLHNSGNNYDELYERYGLLFDAKSDLAAELDELKTAKADAVQMAREAFAAVLDRGFYSETAKTIRGQGESLFSRAFNAIIPFIQSQPAAPAATPSEPTVEKIQWFQWYQDSDLAYYGELRPDGTEIAYYKNGEPRGDPDEWNFINHLGGLWKRRPGEPEAVRKWREEHEDSLRQALPREVEFWKNKADNLTTQLAERDKRIAELTPLYEVLAEVVNLLNQKYGLHFKSETIEKLKQLNKKER